MSSLPRAAENGSPSAAQVSQADGYRHLSARLPGRMATTGEAKQSAGTRDVITKSPRRGAAQNLADKRPDGSRRNTEKGVGAGTEVEVAAERPCRRKPAHTALLATNDEGVDPTESILLQRVNALLHEVSSRCVQYGLGCRCMKSPEAKAQLGIGDATTDLRPGLEADPTAERGVEEGSRVQPPAGVALSSGKPEKSQTTAPFAANSLGARDSRSAVARAFSHEPLSLAYHDLGMHAANSAEQGLETRNQPERSASIAPSQDSSGRLGSLPEGYTSAERLLSPSASLSALETRSLLDVSEKVLRLLSASGEQRRSSASGETAPERARHRRSRLPDDFSAEPRHVPLVSRRSKVLNPQTEEGEAVTFSVSRGGSRGARRRGSEATSHRERTTDSAEGCAESRTSRRARSRTLRCCTNTAALALSDWSDTFLERNAFSQSHAQQPCGVLHRVESPQPKPPQGGAASNPPNGGSEQMRADARSSGAEDGTKTLPASVAGRSDSPPSQVTPVQTAPHSANDDAPLVAAAPDGDAGRAEEFHGAFSPSPSTSSTSDSEAAPHSSLHTPYYAQRRRRTAVRPRGDQERVQSPTSGLYVPDCFQPSPRLSPSRIVKGDDSPVSSPSPLLSPLAPPVPRREEAAERFLGLRDNRESSTTSWAPTPTPNYLSKSPSFDLLRPDCSPRAAARPPAPPPAHTEAPSRTSTDVDNWFLTREEGLGCSSFTQSSTASAFCASESTASLRRRRAACRVNPCLPLSATVYSPLGIPQGSSAIPVHSAGHSRSHAAACTRIDTRPGSCDVYPRDVSSCRLPLRDSRSVPLQSSRSLGKDSGATVFSSSLPSRSQGQLSSGVPVSPGHGGAERELYASEADVGSAVSEGRGGLDESSLAGGAGKLVSGSGRPPSSGSGSCRMFSKSTREGTTSSAAEDTAEEVLSCSLRGRLSSGASRIGGSDPSFEATGGERAGEAEGRACIPCFPHGGGKPESEGETSTGRTAEWNTWEEDVLELEEQPPSISASRVRWNQERPRHEARDSLRGAEALASEMASRAAPPHASTGVNSDGLPELDRPNRVQKLSGNSDQATVRDGDDLIRGADSSEPVPELSKPTILSSAAGSRPQPMTYRAKFEGITLPPAGRHAVSPPAGSEEPLTPLPAGGPLPQADSVCTTRLQAANSEPLRNQHLGSVCGGASLLPGEARGDEGRGQYGYRDRRGTVLGEEDTDLEPHASVQRGALREAPKCRMPLSAEPYGTAGSVQDAARDSPGHTSGEPAEKVGAEAERGYASARPSQEDARNGGRSLGGSSGIGYHSLGSRPSYLASGHTSWIGFREPTLCSGETLPASSRVGASSAHASAARFRQAAAFRVAAQDCAGGTRRHCCSVEHASCAWAGCGFGGTPEAGSSLARRRSIQSLSARDKSGECAESPVTRARVRRRAAALFRELVRAEALQPDAAEALRLAVQKQLYGAKSAGSGSGVACSSEDEELRHCTFRPQINRRSSTQNCLPRIPWWQRLYSGYRVPEMKREIQLLQEDVEFMTGKTDARDEASDDKGKEQKQERRHTRPGARLVSRDLSRRRQREEQVGKEREQTSWTGAALPPRHKGATENEHVANLQSRQEVSWVPEVEYETSPFASPPAYNRPIRKCVRFASPSPTRAAPSSRQRTQTENRSFGIVRSCLRETREQAPTASACLTTCLRRGQSAVVNKFTPNTPSTRAARDGRYDQAGRPFCEAQDGFSYACGESTVARGARSHNSELHARTKGWKSPSRGNGGHVDWREEQDGTSKISRELLRTYLGGRNFVPEWLDVR
ncbi:hypothetical protein BESB_012670 [Besnoitia besnoiti]|uniref:Uncharacterized protein n=1 Tax=Besnoitia besnoiti TaxID=94643 RepID=A0A2A9M3X1_BESBE|nr:hypothetical protein BESB_012670 [Besnoitia besnoiti]PFH32655.1 hypothetical protein BESB_012670 [Besnoitia besnoiti]